MILKYLLYGLLILPLIHACGPGSASITSKKNQTYEIVGISSGAPEPNAWYPGNPFIDSSGVFAAFKENRLQAVNSEFNDLPSGWGYDYLYIHPKGVIQIPFTQAPHVVRGDGQNAPSLFDCKGHPRMTRYTASSKFEYTPCSSGLMSNTITQLKEPNFEAIEKLAISSSLLEIAEQFFGSSDALKKAKAELIVTPKIIDKSGLWKKEPLVSHTIDGYVYWNSEEGLQQALLVRTTKTNKQFKIKIEQPKITIPLDRTLVQPPVVVQGKYLNAVKTKLTFPGKDIDATITGITPEGYRYRLSYEITNKTGQYVKVIRAGIRSGDYIYTHKTTLSLSPHSKDRNFLYFTELFPQKAFTFKERYPLGLDIQYLLDGKTKTFEKRRFFQLNQL